MENLPTENQIKTKIWKMSALSVLLLSVGIGILSIVITAHPPEYYHDLNGLGQAFFLLTFMRIIGVISLVCGVLFFIKSQKKIISILLIIVGLIYLIPQAFFGIRTIFEKIIYHRAYEQQTIHYQQLDNQKVDFISIGFNQAFSQPVAINDVEDDLIYIKNEHGIFILEVTNAKEIGLLSNPDSFINKSVTVTMDKEYLANHGGTSALPMTEKGTVLIIRNASPELKKRYEEYSAQYPGQWRTSDWYASVENSAFARPYFPVTIQNN